MEYLSFLSFSFSVFTNNTVIIIHHSLFILGAGTKQNQWIVKSVELDQIRYREMSRGRSDSGGWLRGCLVVFAVVSALGVCGPALYWRFKNAITLRNSHSSKLSCPPCLCDCPPPLSLFQLAPGNNNYLLLFFLFLFSFHFLS